MQFNDALYLIANVGTMIVAIPCRNVREILRMPSLIALPKMPPHMRGAANLRDRIVKILDLRTMWDMASHQQELEDFASMLSTREEDHKRWLTELEASLMEKREFKLARDPHNCAFGKWYYNFKTDDHNLRSILNRFEEPHMRIHGIADEAWSHAEHLDFETAMGVVKRTRENELQTMLGLFEQARQIIRNSSRELLLVLTDERHNLGVSIDTVQSVETILSETVEPIEPMLLSGGSGYISHTAKRSKTKEVVLLLDSERMLSKFGDY